MYIYIYRAIAMCVCIYVYIERPHRFHRCRSWKHETPWRQAEQQPRKAGNGKAELATAFSLAVRALPVPGYTHHMQSFAIWEFPKIRGPSIAPKIVGLLLNGLPNRSP